MDLVIINGNVHTMDYRDTLAQAVAIQGGRIVAVGANADVQEYRKPGVPVIDARGQTVLPGFVEPHDHLAAQPAWKLGVNLDTTPDVSIADVVRKVKERAAVTPRGEWILGNGYDQTFVSDMRHLTKLDLDAATSEHPVFISHVSGHLAYVNSMALELAEIHSEREDPPGGRFYRFEGTP